ncbi:MAG TPA: (2Fe-2S)-binding protein, partial [Nitrospira sp.]|nr:(2Fe-2S)-binding protein [Nitrospira sp.]
MSQLLSPEVLASRSAPLFGFWYPAVPSHRLRPGTMTALKMLDLPILLCRDRAGMLAAMRDLCPHRGMPMSFGRFDGELVECPYHGWQFDMKGRCQRIPALPEGGSFQCDKIGVATYPVEET